MRLKYVEAEDKIAQKKFKQAQKSCRIFNEEEKSEPDNILYLYMYCESQLKINKFIILLCS